MYMPRKYQLKHNFPIANTSNGIRINLCHDMDKILAQKLENMGIKRKSPTDASMDYFRLQRRLVTTQPRRIVKSKEFTCPKAYTKKLLFIENWIKQGKNLSPFMSRTITDLKKEDMMLYDWGIFHLHLSDEFDLEKRDGFMKRSAYLLMVRISEDTVYFIQVIPHNQKNVWTNSDYIRILRDNWPENISGRKLVDIQSTQPISESDLAKLRQAHVTTIFDVDGECYALLGDGYASDGTSITAVNRCDYWQRYLANIEKHLVDNFKNYLELLPELRSAIGSNYTLEIKLIAFSEEGVLLHEIHSELLIRIREDGELQNTEIMSGDMLFLKDLIEFIDEYKYPAFTKLKKLIKRYK